MSGLPTWLRGRLERSLSRTWGLAGLRVGYLPAAPARSPSCGRRSSRPTCCAGRRRSWGRVHPKGSGRWTATGVDVPEDLDRLVEELQDVLVGRSDP